MTKRPVIIDCDTGTDDAIAIVAALYCEEIDVRAFTTVNGNVALKYTCQNTLDLVRYLGFDTKVAVGAPRPIFLTGPTASSDGTHGATGLGGVEIPRTDAEFYDKNAVETIYEEAVKAEGELELIPVGPLTNIAHAIMAHPDIVPMIKQIVLMGGAKYGGNVTSNAEFNIWVDPEACKIVMESGIPLTMVGLDVTLKAELTQEDSDHIRSMGSKACDVVADILDWMVVRMNNGGEEPLMHDALALAMCIDPTICSGKDYFVDCECDGKYTRGHTFVAVTHRHKGPENCFVCEDVDMDKFRTWLFKAMANSK